MMKSMAGVQQNNRNIPLTLFILFFMLLPAPSLAIRAPSPGEARAYEEAVEREGDKEVEHVTLVQREYTHECDDETLAALKELFFKNHIPMEDLRIVKEIKIDTPRGEQRHVTLLPLYRGLPMVGADNRLTFVAGKVRRPPMIKRPPAGFNISPLTSHEAAAEAAKGHFFGIARFSAELVILSTGGRGDDAAFTLAWRIRKEEMSEYPVAYVDAEKGSLLSMDSGIRY